MNEPVEVVEIIVWRYTAVGAPHREHIGARPHSTEVSPVKDAVAGYLAAVPLVSPLQGAMDTAMDTAKTKKQQSEEGR